MKNREIVININNIGKFIENEKISGESKLSVTGSFRVIELMDKLTEMYKPYKLKLDEILAIEDEEIKNEQILELLEVERELNMDFYKISERDFKDGVTIEEIQMLKFMF